MTGSVSFTIVLLARAQIPESYEVEHVAKGRDGQSATLYVLGQFPAMREIERPRTRMEEMISLVKWLKNKF